jgi:hypothetical protein
MQFYKYNSKFFQITDFRKLIKNHFTIKKEIAAQIRKTNQDQPHVLIPAVPVYQQFYKYDFPFSEILFQ